MAAELEAAFPGIEVKLLESSGGTFDVAVDGTLVFSKKQARRHAEPGEVIEAVKARGLAR